MNGDADMYLNYGNENLPTPNIQGGRTGASVKGKRSWRAFSSSRATR